MLQGCVHIARIMKDCHKFVATWKFEYTKYNVDGLMLLYISNSKSSYISQLIYYQYSMYVYLPAVAVTVETTCPLILVTTLLLVVKHSTTLSVVTGLQLKVV